MHCGCKNKAVRRPEDKKCAALEGVYLNLMNWDHSITATGPLFSRSNFFYFLIELIVFGLSMSP